jgi:hypothetical protein
MEGFRSRRVRFFLKNHGWTSPRLKIRVELDRLKTTLLKGVVKDQGVNLAGVPRIYYTKLGPIEGNLL